MLDGNLARTGIGWSPDENLTLIERFTRLDNDRMIYEFTINDPTVWTKPWTASLPMTRIDKSIYEYACHEGNHDFGLKESILASTCYTFLRRGSPRASQLVAVKASSVSPSSVRLARVCRRPRTWDVSARGRKESGGGLGRATRRHTL